ncbi:MAG: TlpA family protein disulfide reductase [Thermodesulfovibrionales bacterium]
MQKIIVIFAIVLTIGACEKERPRVEAEVGKPAPAFSLIDTDGNRVSLSDLKGRVTILEFWATWCGPCQESVPELNVLEAKFGGSDVTVLGISVDEEEDASAIVREFAAKHKIGYPILIADEGTKTAYGIMSIPVLFILDRGHVIKSRHVGYRPGMSKELIAEIEAML